MINCDVGALLLTYHFGNLRGAIEITRVFEQGAQLARSSLCIETRARQDTATAQPRDPRSIIKLIVRVRQNQDRLAGTQSLTCGSHAALVYDRASRGSTSL